MEYIQLTEYPRFHYSVLYLYFYDDLSVTCPAVHEAENRMLSALLSRIFYESTHLSARIISVDTMPDPALEAAGRYSSARHRDSDYGSDLHLYAEDRFMVIFQPWYDGGSGSRSPRSQGDRVVIPLSSPTGTASLSLAAVCRLQAPITREATLNQKGISRPQRHCLAIALYGRDPGRRRRNMQVTGQYRTV